MGRYQTVYNARHETSRWLDRQVAKLLPVEYFMVTFTLPFQLRSLAWRHQKTGKTCFRTLKGEDFCWLVLQHVLPKDFRRVRDYGFLHGNAKTKLKLVQRVVCVIVELTVPRLRPVFKCPHCQAPMTIVGFIPPHWNPG